MIKLDFNNNSFLVKLEKGSPSYSSAFFVLRSLLCYKYLGDGVFSIDYDDFLTLTEKLNKIGVTDNRVMSKTASRFISYLNDLDQYYNDIKKGIKIKETEALISGKLKSSLYKDQLVGISYLLCKEKVGLFDSMGLGKTLQALATIVALGGKVKKTLVVCPKSVIYGFLEEVKKHTSLNAICVPSGRDNGYKFLVKEKDLNWDILIINPENLVNSEKRGNEKGSLKGKKNTNIFSKILPELIKINFDMVIVDEWHQYKNLDTKRTKCILHLFNELEKVHKKVLKVILMTGTHISESPLNAYSTLSVLSSSHLPNVDWFENYFVVKKQFEKFRFLKDGKTGRINKYPYKYEKIVGYKNLSELKRRIERCSIRRTKEDMEGFPDKIFITRKLELFGKQKELYKVAGKIAVDGFQKDVNSNVNDFFLSGSGMRLRKLLNHPSFLEEQGDSVKYLELDNILEEIFSDKEQKVVIWTEFRHAVDLIYDRWNEQYGVIKLYGGVDINDDLVKKFENDEVPRIIAAIPAKAGTGVDFLARARTAIYIDRPYSLTNYRQSMDRIYRRVAKENLTRLDKIKSQPAVIMFLDVADSVDEFIADRIYEKSNVSDAISISNDKLIKIGRSDLLRYLK